MELLKAYLADRLIFDNVYSCLVSKQPFEDSRGAYIYLSDFRKWIKQNRQLIGIKKLAELLRSAGAKRIIKYAMVKGKETTRCVWRLPGRY